MLSASFVLWLTRLAADSLTAAICVIGDFSPIAATVQYVLTLHVQSNATGKACLNEGDPVIS